MAGLFAASATKTQVRSRVLGPLEAASLTSRLRVDASDFYYSAWISFLDAISGIQKGFYTWATVKLYYSVYYSFSASLSIDDFCAFHFRHSSYSVRAQPGASPQSTTDGGSHKTILKAFERLNPGHALLSQTIDLNVATDWLIGLREDANYRRARFSEPTCENPFLQIDKLGLRKALVAYSSDKSASFAFDPDHAVMAYPLLALQLIGQQVATAGNMKALTDEETKFLRSKARDKSGLLSILITDLKTLKLLN
jgi:hypothetical protein